MTRSQEDIKEYQRKYRLAHKEERRAYDKKNYDENKEYFEEKNNNYHLENKEDRKKYKKNYYQINKHKINDSCRIYIKHKRNNNVSFNLRCQVSKNINRILKSQGSSKNGNSILDFLYYSIQELKEHIEKQFESWMTWNNWGVYDSKTWDDNNNSTWTWQLDHIIPQSKLLYTSMEDDNFKRCWALNNLRPLSSKQNLLDGNRR